MPRSGKRLVGVRFSRGSGARGGQAPALRYARLPPFHRRARACPSPCLGWGNGPGRWTIFARVERSRGTGPRATVKNNVPLTVGRGPVPRRASIGKTALVGVRFLRESCARGGQAPALRLKKRAAARRARACPSPCLGREGKRPLSACVFCAGRALAGDRPPRYGPGRVFLSMRRAGSGAPELRSLGHASDHGGQAPALRLKKTCR